MTLLLPGLRLFLGSAPQSHTYPNGGSRASTQLLRGQWQPLQPPSLGQHCLNGREGQGGQETTKVSSLYPILPLL